MASQAPLNAPLSTQGPELILVLKPDVQARNSTKGLLLPSAGDSISPIQELLSEHRATLKVLFGPSEERVRLQQDALPSAAPSSDSHDQFVALPDLSKFYSVSAPSSELDALAKKLFDNDQVEAAYIKPAGSPPILFESPRPTEDAPPATPNYLDHQIYLNTAPNGIDAKIAWTIPGGKGAGLRCVDCEWGWRFTHEDLLANQGGVIAGTTSTDTNHGTAVIGVISGDINSTGITGIAPDSVISASSFNDQATSTAIKKAADKLSAGDVLLLEIHRPGPRTPNPRQGQLGFIAIEWWPDDFAAIQYAVAKGIVVVEAAGNGFQNFDDPIYDAPAAGFPSTWKNPFKRGNPQSGAVVVGAGAPPPGTHGRDHGPDRSRLDFSNYGARVDVQGWGREVTSTGYGDLQSGLSADLWYTDVFNGTSSASPIVTGAVLSAQGVLKARGRRRLTSQEAARLLRKTGSPQQDAPGRITAQRIGKRPNLRLLIAAAANLQCRSADFDGDNKADILVASAGGIALLKQNGTSMQASMVQNNNVRFGGWLLDTNSNSFGPVADFDGDRRAETFVTSPWGIGILKKAGNTMAASVIQPNGTRFGGWLLNTNDNSFGPAADYDGDGKSEILVTSPWGVGILKQNGTTMTAPLMAPNGTRFGGWLLNTADNEFGPVGDFNGDGKADILITSPWGIAVLQQDGSTFKVLMMAQNGTRFAGGWLLNTADNRFGPVGDFDGDGKMEILITSPWGIGILKLSGNTFNVPMIQPNDTRFGGWLLNTADNDFGPARKFTTGSNKAQILVTSPWGIGLLEQNANTMVAPMMQPNGTRFSGGWLLNTANDWLGTAADFDGDGTAEILVTSPWGFGILKRNGNTMISSTMQPNGQVGAWVVDTASNDFGHGV